MTRKVITKKQLQSENKKLRELNKKLQENLQEQKIECWESAIYATLERLNLNRGMDSISFVSSVGSALLEADKREEAGTAGWEKLREVRNKMRKALRKASNRVPPSPAPRYDEVYAEGTTWMNSKG